MEGLLLKSISNITNSAHAGEDFWPRTAKLDRKLTILPEQTWHPSKRPSQFHMQERANE